MSHNNNSGKENVLRFKLDGAEYTLRGDMSVERLETVVKLVEQKVSGIREIMPNYTAVRVSTLAALQLAADLLDAREENELILAEARSGVFLRTSAPKKAATRGSGNKE